MRNSKNFLTTIISNHGRILSNREKFFRQCLCWFLLILASFGPAFLDTYFHKIEPAVMQFYKIQQDFTIESRMLYLYLPQLVSFITTGLLIDYRGCAPVLIASSVATFLTSLCQYLSFYLESYSIFLLCLISYSVSTSSAQVVVYKLYWRVLGGKRFALFTAVNCALQSIFIETGSRLLNELSESSRSDDKVRSNVELVCYIMIAIYSISLAGCLLFLAARSAVEWQKAVKNRDSSLTFGKKAKFFDLEHFRKHKRLSLLFLFSTFLLGATSNGFYRFMKDFSVDRFKLTEKSEVILNWYSFSLTLVGMLCTGFFVWMYGKRGKILKISYLLCFLGMFIYTTVPDCEDDNCSIPFVFELFNALAAGSSTVIFHATVPYIFGEGILGFVYGIVGVINIVDAIIFPPLTKWIMQYLSQNVVLNVNSYFWCGMLYMQLDFLLLCCGTLIDRIDRQSGCVLDCLGKPPIYKRKKIESNSESLIRRTRSSESALDLHI